jgi:hypothetical protein
VSIPIDPSKSLCRLLCDTTHGVSSGVAPNLALRSGVSRALFALSAWKASAYRMSDGVAIATYSRRFLEGSTTALLFRIDPLRVLALRELQRGGSYQLTKRNALAVQWSGDIVSTENAPPQLRDCEPNKLDRALFSSLCAATIWKPALEDLQTHLSTHSSHTDWQLELLKIEPEEFTRTMAGQLNNCFSFFSKGVHNEWVDRRRVGLREADARTYANSCLRLVSFCAATLCFAPHEKHRHIPTKIIDRLAIVESEFGTI